MPTRGRNFKVIIIIESTASTRDLKAPSEINLCRKDLQNQNFGDLDYNHNDYKYTCNKTRQ